MLELRNNANSEPETLNPKLGFRVSGTLNSQKWSTYTFGRARKDLRYGKILPYILLCELRGMGLGYVEFFLDEPKTPRPLNPTPSPLEPASGGGDQGLGSQKGKGLGFWGLGSLMSYPKQASPTLK